MNELSLFTTFWTREGETTHRVLSRIPEGSTYRPDPRARTAQELAWQIVQETRWILDALESGHLEVGANPVPQTVREILEVHAALVAGARLRLSSLGDDRWGGTITAGPRARPASAMAWSFLFDLIHHRGQLTTYLRPMGSTVPQVYGPSADEP